MLTSDFLRVARAAESFGYPVLGGVRIYQGAIVGVTAGGFLAPAHNAGVAAIVGIAETWCDNRDGADGAATINALKGVYAFPPDTLTVADIGKDLQAKSDDLFEVKSAKPKAGTLMGISDGCAWVRV